MVLVPGPRKNTVEGQEKYSEKTGQEGEKARMSQPPTCSLPHYEAVTVLVPGPRGARWVVVPLGQRLACDEAADPRGDHRSLGASSQHQVRLTTPDVLGSTAGVGKTASGQFLLLSAYAALPRRMCSAVLRAWDSIWLLCITAWP